MDLFGRIKIALHILALLPLTIAGCDRDATVAPVVPGEMPIYEIRRNPIIWQSDPVVSGYNSSDSIATIRLPRFLLDTSEADEIVISYEMYGWPECDVVSATTGKHYRVQCPSMFDIWWGGRYEIALSGFEPAPTSAFVDGSRRIRLWSRANPRAWARLVKFRSSYEPLLLNKVGREFDSYTGEGRIQMASDSDGVWLGWWADLDLPGCPAYGQSLPVDSLVKLDAAGARVDEIVIHDIPIRDFTVAAGSVWVLTPEPDQQILKLMNGVVVDDYDLERLGLYEYSTLMFVRDTLWTAETHLAQDEWQLKLRQFDFTTSSPTAAPTQTDSLMFPGYIEVGPTWDGESFVYWAYGSHGQLLIRRDRAGRVIESVHSTLALSGDVCRALGSYWVTHHGPYEAGNRGVFISRISF